MQEYTQEKIKQIYDLNIIKIKELESQNELLQALEIAQKMHKVFKNSSEVFVIFSRLHDRLYGLNRVRLEEFLDIKKHEDFKKWLVDL